MGYLDGSTVTVDAILTKQGRRMLAQGQSLNVTHFTLSDQGVDYELWNTGHPSGSAYYGEAIENLPQMEALPQAEYFMRNRLVSLDRDTTKMPVISLSPKTYTFLANSTDRDVISIQTLNYSQEDSFMVIVPNSQLLIPASPASYQDISGTAHQYVSAQDIPYAKAVKVNTVNGTATVEFQQAPDDTAHDITLTIVSMNTGAFGSHTVSIPINTSQNPVL